MAGSLYRKLTASFKIETTIPLRVLKTQPSEGMITSDEYSLNLSGIVSSRAAFLPLGAVTRSYSMLISLRGDIRYRKCKRNGIVIRREANALHA